MKKEVIVNNLNHVHYNEIFETEKKYRQVQSKKKHIDSLKNNFKMLKN